MHGGAKGSGGPRGKENGNYRAWQYTKDMLAGRKRLTQKGVIDFNRLLSFG